MNKLIIFFFLLSVFFLTLLPVKDTDFGWHYRCGNQFLSNGKLCINNGFSYFLQNYKAYYTGHVYDIILALIYNWGGFFAVSILGAFIFTLSALVFFYLIHTDSIVKIAGFFLIFFLSYPVFYLGLRPQIISFLFFLILLFILNQRNKKILFFIPLLFFVWVNIHIGFFVGLIVLLFYTLEKTLVRNFTPFVIFFISIFATFINPFGINVYKEIFNHALSPLNTMIAEWVPPSIFHIIIIITLSIIGLTQIAQKKPFSLYRTLLLIFFGILALKAVRNLPFFYASLTYILLDDLKVTLKNYSLPTIPFLAAISIFIAIIQLPQTIHHSTSWDQYCNRSISAVYPCDAIRKYPQLSGNVYALYEWGGFLIWQKPNIKIFVDGRMPAWKDENGKSPYQVYLEIIQTQDGWNEKLRTLKTNYIFITNGTFLDLLLAKDAAKYGWEEVYRDNSAVIYQNVI